MPRDHTRNCRFLSLEFLDDRLCPSSYGITDLGTLGGTSSVATALNHSGQIVGSAYLPGNTASHAFLWQNGAMTDLGGLGGTHCGANAINDSTQVVGEGETGAIDANGLPVRRAFLWQSGTMVDLGALGGPSSAARGMNSAGQVVGDATTTTLDVNGIPIWHAFVWQGSLMTDLNNLLPAGSGWVLNYAGGINDNGQVVGEGFFNGQDRAYLYDLGSGTIMNLGTLDGPRSAANAINSGGQVAGWASNSKGNVHAFRYSSGAMTDLGTLSGGNYSVAYGITTVDQVVGHANFSGSGRTFPPTYHAVIWQSGHMRDLNSLIPNHSGWELTHAAGIDSNGAIVGSGTVGGQSHAFVLTPTASPLDGSANEPIGRDLGFGVRTEHTPGFAQYRPSVWNATVSAIRGVTLQVNSELRDWDRAGVAEDAWHWSQHEMRRMEENESINENAHRFRTDANALIGL
jgi:probable HAF family extracellular repeat protein